MLRRSLLSGAAAVALVRQANARTISMAGVFPPVTVTLVTPEIHISNGQSWRANSFDSFASPYAFNQQAQTLLAPSLAGAVPLANSAGINLPGSITGIVGYASTDVFAVGRCAVLAQQLLRVRVGGGLIPLRPIIEFCHAYPSSNWLSGPGGGLSPGCNFTASITSDLMTVTAVSSGQVISGQVITAGSGIPANYYINLGGTGTGGTGTYPTFLAQTVIAGTMTTAGSAFTASIGGAVPNNVLTVTAQSSGTISVGETLVAVSSGSILANTKIASQLTGAAGGIGTYKVLVGTAITVGSQAMASTGSSWRNLLLILSGTNSVLPTGRYLAADYRSVGYTQGGSTPDTIAQKASDLTAMIVDYDALGLSSSAPLKFYIGLPSQVSTTTSIASTDSMTAGIPAYCRTNAPAAGGTYSGRVYATAPSYAWPFNGNDNIHTGDYGSARWGEWEGYVRHQVQDIGVAWTPLWRPLTGGAITVSGQVVTVPWARPAGADFASAAMVMQSSALDGIKVWPQNGFNINRSGVALTVTPSISGMNVLLTVAETLSPGDVLEVSYGYYGPGGTNPGPCTGVGGNLTMKGPASVLFPGNTLDAWAWPFLESITA